MNHDKTADTISVPSHCIDANTNLIYLDCFIELVSVTRKVGRPTAGQFSSTCGELEAFGHLDSCMDSCMESCIVRDHSC